MNEDGKLDFLAVENDYSAESNCGRNDALNGLLVLRKDDFFEVVPSKNSGFYVPEQSYNLIEFNDKNNKRYFIATPYNNQAQVFLKN